MDVKTIGDLYTISNKLPSVSLPSINFTMIRELFPDALLNCGACRYRIHSYHVLLRMVWLEADISLIWSLLHRGPAMLYRHFWRYTGNGCHCKNSGKYQEWWTNSGCGYGPFSHTLLILVVLMPYAAWIPMPAIAAILFMVAYNMSGWREFVSLCKTSPKSDIPCSCDYICPYSGI